MAPPNSVSTLLLGAVSIAAMHALIPSHWLSFAVIGRSQKWSIRRTLLVTLMAGGGHVLLTVLLGLGVAGAGKTLQRALPPPLEHAATSVLLIGLGLYSLIPALRGREGCPNHDHVHLPHPETNFPPENETAKLLAVEKTHRSKMARFGENPTVIGALVLGMTLSPCLDLLSVYVAAASLSWPLLLAVSGLLALTTLSLMFFLVWLTLLGLQRLNLAWLDRHEGAVMGTLLIVLGLLLPMLH